MNRPIRMTRRVTFSSGHRYWLISKSDEENFALFGKWASKFNHGHNYVLEVTVEGNVASETGMIVNIKTIDDILRSRIVRKFDGRSINDEIDFFADRPSSVENLLEYIKSELCSPEVLPSEVALVGLRLEEMPTLFGELTLLKEQSLLTLTRVYEFAASHRLHSPSLSHEENISLYGKCNNEAGHGHNYTLEVTVGGTPDPATGMLMSILELDQIVEDSVLTRYDHKNLNVDVAELEGKITTSEVVAQSIFDSLRVHLKDSLKRIRLYETARNMFEVSA